VYPNPNEGITSWTMETAETANYQGRRVSEESTRLSPVALAQDRPGSASACLDLQVSRGTKPPSREQKLGVLYYWAARNQIRTPSSSHLPLQVTGRRPTANGATILSPSITTKATFSDAIATKPQLACLPAKGTSRQKTSRVQPGGQNVFGGSGRATCQACRASRGEIWFASCGWLGNCEHTELNRPPEGSWTAPPAYE